MTYEELIAKKQKEKADALAAQQAQTVQTVDTSVTEPQKMDAWTAIKYGAERFGAGVYGAMENFTDFVIGGGAKAAGAVASALGNEEYAAQADEVAKMLNDVTLTQDYQQSIQERYNPTETAYYIGSVVEQVGNMVPSVLLNAAIPGSGLAFLGAQAAGGGTQQAYEETGNLGIKEYGYGVLSGTAEVGIEKISGGIGGLASESFVKGMIGEGLEEVASTALDPFLKEVTYKPGAVKEAYGSKEAITKTAKEAGKSFTMGTITSGVLQSGQNVVNIAQYKSVGSKVIENNNTQSVTSEVLAKADKTKDAYKTAKILQTKIANNQTISPVTVGKMTMQYNAEVMESKIKSVQKEQNVSRKEAIKIIDESLAVDRMDSRYFVKSDNAEDATAQADAISRGNISNKTIKQVADFAKETNADIRYIYSEDNIEGYFKNGKTYINTKMGNVAYYTAVHEQIHNLEVSDSAKYNQVKEAVLGLSNDILKGKEAEIRALYAKAVVNGKALNLTEQEIDGEVVAKLAIELIDSPEKLNAAIRKNKTFVERIRDFVKDLLDRAKGLFSTDEQKRLKSAYNTLAEALKSDTEAKAEVKGETTKFSLPNTVEKDVLKEYGKTYKWVETGYILLDGIRVDLSGKSQGATGGSRQVDHRDVFGIYEDGDTYGTKALIEFMGRGNIRVTPETPGINIQIKPTEAQYQQIRNFIDNYAFKEKYFNVDFDDSKGNTVGTLTYENNIRAERIINDIKRYFETGKIPAQSSVDSFRYSLPSTDSEGNALSDAQREFFKDSKVVDDKGRLLKVYHGTNAKFNVFKYGYGSRYAYGAGFYFSPFEDEAFAYGNRIVKSYINIAKPVYKGQKNITQNEWSKYIEFAKDNASKYIKADWKGNDVLENYKNSELAKYDVALLSDFISAVSGGNNEVAVGYFNMLKDSIGYDGIISGNTYIVFSPNQIKLTANLNPTENEDIRYSMPEDATERNVVLTKMPSKAQLPFWENARQTAKNAWLSLRVGISDEWAGVEDTGKRLGVKDITVRTQKIRSAINAAQGVIAGDVQLDVNNNKVGRGLHKILEPVFDKGESTTQDFYNYLAYVHNIDRLNYAETKYNNEYGANAYQSKLTELQNNVNDIQSSLDKLTDTTTERYAKLQERLTKAQNALEAHTFYNAVTYLSVKDSQAKADAILKANPNFKAVSEELYKYSDNLLQYRVDSRLITQEFADELRKTYPSYIPTFRDTEAKLGTGSLQGKFNLKVSKTIRKAEGSNLDILPIGDIIAQQTIKVYRAAHPNMLAKTIYDAAVAKNDFSDIEVKDRKKLTAKELEDVNYDDYQPKNNEITFFDGDEVITMRVSNAIFYGFNSASGNQFSAITENVVFKAVNKLNTNLKKLVTSWSPAFAIRNPIRDFQEAGLYSTDFKAFAKKYPQAFKQITQNSELWQTYRAMGVMSSSIFDLEKGFIGKQNAWGLTKAEGSIFKKLPQLVENTNIMFEQLPRFAEFLASVERGETLDQAALNAADVTVNFGRTGTITKLLNKTFFPFLNPSIQGTSKLIRSFTSAKAANKLVSLLVKCAVLGIAPQLLQMLMYGGDDEYEAMNIRDKENNYLFKVGDKWIKIPKGRVLSVLAGATLRAGMTLQGEKDAWDGYLSNVLQQVTPIENFSRSIFSPFKDVATNTTWYGTKIVGEEFKNTKPSEQYDESTSGIAKAIGKVLNYSPLKINYLLDQYSGVFGDILLPYTTDKAERGYFESAFTVDPVLSNNYSTKFYKLYDKANYAKTDGDAAAALQVRYLNSVKNGISELYNQKSEIESSGLTDSEKKAQIRLIQASINAAYKSAIDNYSAVSSAVSEAITSEYDTDRQYAEALRSVFGSEIALQEYNSAVYDNAKIINLGGIDYNTYYDYYFATKDLTADKDKDGNTISGSLKTKVIKQIAALDITTDQKLLMIMANGYTVQDGEIKGISASAAKKRVAQYIAGLDITKEEKITLAQKCGLTVENGKIVVK